MRTSGSERRGRALESEDQGVSCRAPLLTLGCHHKLRSAGRYRTRLCRSPVRFCSGRSSVNSRVASHLWAIILAESLKFRVTLDLLVESPCLKIRQPGFSFLHSCLLMIKLSQISSTCSVINVISMTNHMLDYMRPSPPPPTHSLRPTPDRSSVGWSP